MIGAGLVMQIVASANDTNVLVIEIDHIMLVKRMWHGVN
jgi:hypothetical protein